MPFFGGRDLDAGMTALFHGHPIDETSVAEVIRTPEYYDEKDVAAVSELACKTVARAVGVTGLPADNREPVAEEFIRVSKRIASARPSAPHDVPSLQTD